jgi:hypothetical protein
MEETISRMADRSRFLHDDQPARRARGADRAAAAAAHDDHGSLPRSGYRRRRGQRRVCAPCSRAQDAASLVQA